MTKNEIKAWRGQLTGLRNLVAQVRSLHALKPTTPNATLDEFARDVSAAIRDADEAIKQFDPDSVPPDERVARLAAQIADLPQRAVAFEREWSSRSNETHALMDAITGRESAEAAHSKTKSPIDLRNLRRAEMEERRARNAHKMKHG